MASRPKFNLESSFAKLEAAIDKLEDEQTSLQASLEAFESGINLTRQAQQALREAEQKVKLLLEANNGGPQEEDFSEGKTE